MSASTHDGCKYERYFDINFRLLVASQQKNFNDLVVRHFLIRYVRLERSLRIKQSKKKDYAFERILIVFAIKGKSRSHVEHSLRINLDSS